MGEGALGQRRATACPICGSTNITNWTCPSCTELVAVHRELIRNLQHWRSLFEIGEVSDVLVASDSRSYSLWDVQTFYVERRVTSPRQQQSIQFCLYENMKEKDAALRMGISKSNPVSEYATIGLTAMLGMATRGELSGYFVELGAEEAGAHV